MAAKSGLSVSSSPVAGSLQQLRTSLADIADAASLRLKSSARADPRDQFLGTGGRRRCSMHSCTRCLPSEHGVDQLDHRGSSMKAARTGRGCEVRPPDSTAAALTAEGILGWGEARDRLHLYYRHAETSSRSLAVRTSIAL